MDGEDLLILPRVGTLLIAMVNFLLESEGGNSYPVRATIFSV